MQFNATVRPYFLCHFIRKRKLVTLTALTFTQQITNHVATFFKTGKAIMTAVLF